MTSKMPAATGEETADDDRPAPAPATAAAKALVPDIQTSEEPAQPEKESERDPLEDDSQAEPLEDPLDGWVVEEVKQRPRGRRARSRADRRRRALLRTSPAARRAELAVAAAWLAQEKAAAAGVTVPTAPARHGRIARGLLVLVAVLMLPGAVLALVTTAASTRELARVDASYIAKQLIGADQRVRTQLARLRDNGTAPALDDARDATLTTRSLALELKPYSGSDAARLKRALRLEAAWLDAVGSTLGNPRSALRERLRARDGAARSALSALPATPGSRSGGAQHLVDYARSRERAVAGGRRKR